MVIDRFHSNYVIHKVEEKASAIQERLDRIVANLLTKELDERVSRILYDDSLLCFIRQIAVDIGFDLKNLDDQSIANRWAEKISAEIADEINSTSDHVIAPSEEKNVVTFKNRTEYCAQFIHDLMVDTAWQRWYYQEFEDLSTFRKNEIIMLLLEQHKEIAEDILMAVLEKKALFNILAELTETNAEMVYLKYLKQERTVEIDVDSKEYNESIQRIIQFALSKEESPEVSFDFSTDYKSCLKLYLLLKEALSGYKGTMPQCISKVSLKRAVEDAVFNKDKYLQDMSITAETSEHMILTDTVNEKRIPSEQASLLDVQRQLDSSEICKKVVTSYGGLFLLVPSIIKLKLIDMIDQVALPEYLNNNKINCVLAFLAIEITGKRILEYPPIDPGILLFAGLEQTAAADGFASYAKSTTFSQSKELMKSIRDTLFTFKEQCMPCVDYCDVNSFSSANLQTIDFDTVIMKIGELILRVFARGLRGFEKSNPSYIIKNFIQRRSEIKLDNRFVYVTLGKKPLDTVLRLSSYLEEINTVVWLSNRGVRFSLAR